MFNNLKLENFRNFHALELSGLQSINLITGKNGSGKTAILEAVFLNAGACNTNLLMLINRLRGEDFTAVINDRPFRSLFFNLSPISPISIRSQWSAEIGGSSINRDLIIRAIQPDWKNPQLSNEKIPGVEVDFRASGQRTAAKIRWREEEINPNWPQGRPINAPAAQFNYRLVPELIQHKAQIGAAFVQANPREALQQIYISLVNATRDKTINQILDFVKIVDNRLSNLVPLNEEGINSVYVDIGRNSLVPLTMMGNGFIDILHLACNIIQTSSKVVLIDEIESGLHYSVYPDLVRGLIKICNTVDVQLFITTHSGEMVSVFSEQIKKENFSKICALRVGRHGHDEIVTKFDADDILNSNEIDMDLR